MSEIDTIFALSSGVGRGAVAIIRVSGQNSGEILRRIAGSPLPSPRRAVLRALSCENGALLDQALVLWMPAPRSYTGEDVFELHVHGGRAVIAAAGSALMGLGARPAEPGEFTRRAFLAGKMGLLEAEGIADLIDAETDAQRQQALRQAGGALGARVEAWAREIRHALATQEALIDFPDEGLPDSVEAELDAVLHRLESDMRSALAEGAAAERLREGLVFTILGAPNVGKSSLLNALAQRDAAIVSSFAGTTRDPVEVPLTISGIPVTLVDTAGLRETSDAVEAEGVRRALARAASADFVLGVVAPEGPHLSEPADLLIANKVDCWRAPDGAIPVSARTGQGLDALVTRLGNAAQNLAAAGAQPGLTRARHRAAVQSATDALASACACHLPELRGEELRLALLAIGRLTGVVDAETILGDIFAAFCIGK